MELNNTAWNFSHEVLGTYQGEVIYTVVGDEVFLSFPRQLAITSDQMRHRAAIETLRYESAIRSICKEIGVTLEGRDFIAWDSLRPLSFFEFVSTPKGLVSYYLEVSNTWGDSVRVCSKKPDQTPTAVLEAFERYFAAARALIGGEDDPVITLPSKDEILRLFLAVDSTESTPIVKEWYELFAQQGDGSDLTVHGLVHLFGVTIAQIFEGHAIARHISAVVPNYIQALVKDVVLRTAAENLWREALAATQPVPN